MEPIDINDVIQRYLAGESAIKIAKSLGVTVSAIDYRIQKAGIGRKRSDAARLRRGLPILSESDKTEAIRRYTSGETAESIGQLIGTSTNSIQKIIQDSGITVRGLSESQRLRHTKTTVEQRLQMTAAAHAAVRGVPQSEETRQKFALAMERYTNHRIRVSPKESIIIKMLSEMGVTEIVPQKAIGRYNVDVALTTSSVAVEILGSYSCACGAAAARHRKRFDYLIDRGWLPIIVWSVGRYPISIGAANYIISIHEARCLGKSLGREEHVIRGDGYGGPVSQGYPIGVPVIPCYKSGDGTGGNNSSSRQ